MIIKMLSERADRKHKEKLDQAREFFPEPKAKEYFETIRCKLTPQYYYRELGKHQNSFLSFGTTVIHHYNGKCRLKNGTCGTIQIYQDRCNKNPSVDIDGIDCRLCNVPVLFALKTLEREQ